VETNNTLGRRISAWFALSRMPFHAVGILPFFLGIVIACSQGYPLNFPVGILSTSAVILIMLATYYSGEFYDYETDSLNTSFNKFSGGTRVLTHGMIPKEQALIASLLCLVGAATIGLLLFFYFKTGAYTLPLGAFGMVCGFFYSSRPFQWAYRGVGEILIGLCYGWLTVNTGYYLQTRQFDFLPTLVSIPIGISIFLVILINEFPDHSSDRVSGKRNLVVRLGREKASWLYATLSGVCFVVILLGIFHGVPKIIAAFSVIPLILVTRNLFSIKKREFLEGKLLERLCGRTFLLNLGITFFYIITFLGRHKP
jgi:1,4-dihydroxy-2-naphthoate octaprenyltransferase